MTEQVNVFLEFYKSREYRKCREEIPLPVDTEVSREEEQAFIPKILQLALEAEVPRFYPNDIFGFNRSKKYSGRILPNRWRCGNITCDWMLLIQDGFRPVLSLIEEKLPSADAEAVLFYTAVKNCLDAILAFCEKYRHAAEKEGHVKLSAALARIPMEGASDLYEACLFQKLLIFALRYCFNDHITLGRFDQYMYPYYKKEKERGATEEEILTLLELYFVSLNIDTDLYYGIQQGDNGQSMVLGGYDLDGTDRFNPLSELCMRASLELGVIDPKINLRVNKTTPKERYLLATKLTKLGLGFPQYCNDDVVIPGLIKLGYEPEDAADYTVAACWEFIIPGEGTDIPNCATFNFPLVINEAIHKYLSSASTFEELMNAVEAHIAFAVTKDVVIFCKVDAIWSRHMPAPLLSAMVRGSLEKGRDMTRMVAKYTNFGCHGAGLSTATDALMAVKTVIYDEKSVSKEELLAALNADFANCEALRRKLDACPKAGNGNEESTRVLCRLLKKFSSELNGRSNGSGNGSGNGIWRAGTGSAHEYIYSAQKCPATADGRHAYSPYGCSYSPALGARLEGPLSVIRAFTAPDLTETINGGPLTLELHDAVFRNEMGEEKVAELVHLFVQLGGHQLQLNAVCREKLLDAQAHPENYPHLVVRVWGWSGYFCELEKKFQDHVIARTEFMM